ncbi:MAG: beta-ketoacyl-ACP synthase III [Phycisphaerales bacterium]|jgi:3-oxoacyl-[acyl-carrier-protein] synthase-3|nr:beta-ketoacyl-ACP synthase III [Phycisphaerales bacterium]
MTRMRANGALASAGVRLAGTGSALPARRVTNADLERVMDTSDEWIVQRTGIHERRIADREAGETTASLSATAVRAALADAQIAPTDLDLILCATMTPDMPTPSVACVVASELGAGNIGAIDMNAACSGFVYAINHAYALIKAGMARTIAVIGADSITRHMDFSTYGRGTSILFGDGAGAAVLCATDDASKGLIAQAMHSDGGGGKHLFIPTCRGDFYNAEDFDERKLEKVQMHGSAVFKFAVGTFPDLIQLTLDRAGMAAEDVDHYVCHQSNMRILHAARDRFGLPEEKLCVNIDRVGNTVAASVPLVLDEQRRAGRIREGNRVMFLAFGAGLTWASSLWQL